MVVGCALPPKPLLNGALGAYLWLLILSRNALRLS